MPPPGLGLGLTLARPLVAGGGSPGTIFWAIEEGGVTYLIVLGDDDTPITF